jgi:hypothetical protein
MIDDKKLDELLNGYIDGELDPRQKTEVKRLIAHDSNIADRLEELRQCQQLLASMPSEQAPPTLLHDVQVSIERRSLLGIDSAQIKHKKGVREMFLRKVLTVAAMFILLGALGYVVYDIIGPVDSVDNNLLVFTPDEPKTFVAGEKLNARLQLKTKSTLGAQAVINRALASASLTNFSIIDDNKTVYSLTCSREQFAALVSDIENLWPTLESARLSLSSGAEKLTINAVKPEQITRIAMQADSAQSMQVADAIAAANIQNQLLKGHDAYATKNRLPEATTIPGPIPKPVLTGAPETTKTPVNADSEKDIELEIILIGSE